MLYYIELISFICSPADNLHRNKKPTTLVGPVPLLNPLQWFRLVAKMKMIMKTARSRKHRNKTQSSKLKLNRPEKIFRIPKWGRGVAAAKVTCCLVTTLAQCDARCPQPAHHFVCICVPLVSLYLPQLFFSAPLLSSLFFLHVSRHSRVIGGYKTHLRAAARPPRVCCLLRCEMCTDSSMRNPLRTTW